MSVIENTFQLPYLVYQFYSLGWFYLFYLFQMGWFQDCGEQVKIAVRGCIDYINQRKQLMIEKVGVVNKSRAFSAKSKKKEDRYRINGTQYLPEAEVTVKTSKNNNLKFFDPLIKKVMPKQTNIEKEELLQKNMHLNRQNYLLNQKIKRVQTENRRLKKQHENACRQLKKVSNQNLAYSQPRHLLETIKRQHLSLKKQFQQLQKQNQKLKKQKKYLKTQEIIIELNMYEEECKRLSDMLIKLGEFGEQQKQKLFRRQNRQKKQKVKQLEKQLDQLKDIIQDKEQDIDNHIQSIRNLQLKQISLNTKVRTLLSQNLALKKINEEKEMERKKVDQKHWLEVQHLKDIQNIRFQAQLKQFQQKLSSKNTAILQLQRKVAHYQEMLKHYKVQMIPYQISQEQHQNQQDIEGMQIKSCKDDQKPNVRPRQISLQSKIYKNKSDAIQPKQSQSSKKDITSKREYCLQQPNNSIQEMVQHSSHKNIKFDNRKLRVQLAEISDAVQLIKINLIINNIPFQQITSYLQQQSSNLISIKTLSKILASFPFNLKSKDQIILLCRYLIQDQKQQYTFYDQNKYKDIAIVKSIFRKVIGKYQIRDDRKLRQMRKKAKDFLDFYYPSIKQYFKIIGKDFRKQKSVDSRQFQKIIIQGGLSKQKQLMQFMIEIMVKQSGSIKNMNIESLQQFTKTYEQIELVQSEQYNLQQQQV